MWFEDVIQDCDANGRSYTIWKEGKYCSMYVGAFVRTDKIREQKPEKPSPRNLKSYSLSAQTTNQVD